MWRGWGGGRQVLRLTQKVRREYEPLDRGKYNWTEMKNTFDIQSPKLEEDTEEVIKLWFAEKKLSPPSKTWRLYVAESKYVSNMVSTVRSIRKKWLWILMKRVPNRRKRESQIGGREKCDFFVYNMEEKLVFPVDTCYLCVSDSNDVPNLVVTMHFRQEKRLESRIGRSQGVRSTDPLSKASGSGKLTILDPCRGC